MADGDPLYLGNFNNFATRDTHLDNDGLVLYALSVRGRQSIGVRGIGDNLHGVEGEGKRLGIYGLSGGFGVFGRGTSGAGVVGASTHNTGVFGTSESNAGVRGDSNRSSGVRGISTNSNGVRGSSANSNGVWGQSEVGAGLVGISDSGTGVHAVSRTGYAGRFIGDIDVSGNVYSGNKPFRIDHPLDPENKYLIHVAVESPQMKNVYDGVVELGEDGAAWVELPEYFEELNRDLCYQLSAIGAPAPGLYIAEEVSENRFKIAGGEPGVKVSWQITGIRKDRWAEANPIEVEQEKSDEERGRYLYPELYNEPEERGIRPAIVDDLDLEELRRREEEQIRQIEELRRQLEEQRRQSSTEGQEEAPY
jgi:hypothetical protein